MWTPFKGHQFSTAASVLAAAVIAVLFLGDPLTPFLGAGWWTPSEWTLSEQQQIMSAFAVSYVLLSYLFLQIVAHIFCGPASPKQMLVDMLSSLPPLATVLYVLAEHARGDLALSAFQIHSALLTAYTMTLDLLVDIGLTLWPRRSPVAQALPSRG